MRSLLIPLSLLTLLLCACGPSPQPAAPAAATQATPAPASAPASSSAPAAVTAAAAGTSEAAAEATSVPPAVTDAGPEVAADVALAQGSVTDTASDGSNRALKDGDSVYPGDAFTLGDDSYLDLDFTDGSHILLRPGTRFQIERFHFEPEAHPGPDGEPATLFTPAQPENAFFKLIKGGLRAIDGIIGHTEPQSYGVETPVATIGVRGTAFDVRYCGEDCQDEADASGKPEDGLYTSVDDGSIGVKNDSGETVTPKGHSGFVKSRRERLRALNTPPKALRHMQLPDKLKARDADNHKKVHARQKQRRQARLERRKKRADWEKQHPGAAAKLKAKAASAAKADGKPAPGTHPGKQAEPPKTAPQGKLKDIKARAAKPAPKTAVPERRQQRLQDQEKRDAAKRTKRAAEPAAQRDGRLKELKQERQEKKPEPAAKPKPDKQDKPAKGKDDCKDKKGKKKAKGKDKDKCDG